MSVALPNSEISFVDGGLGNVSPGDATSFKVGSCSSGVAGTFYSFAGTDTEQVTTSLGVGPLAAAVIHHLLESNGQPVIAYKATASTAGSSSAVTQTGTGPTVTLSGAAYDHSETIIEIMVGGVIGTSQFRYSLDGGDTYSDNYATAATYLLPNNVTANMAAGTYVVATTYAWTDTAPVMTTTNVGDALDDIIESAYTGEFVHIVGQAANASDCATMAALISTKRVAAHAAHKYMWFAFEAPAVDKAGLVTAFAAFEDKFVVGFAGFCELIDAKSSRIQKRSSGRVLAPRIARNPISVHPLRDVGDTDIDPIASISKLVPDGAAASTGYHDEERTPGLNAARFCALRTIAGRAGFYPTNGLTFASGTSDYQQIMHMRITLAVARAWYAYTLTQLAKRIRKNATTGYILERFAVGMESKGAAVIQAALADHLRQVQVLINRADNLNTTALKAKVRFVADDYALEWDSEIGLAASLPEAA